MIRWFFAGLAATWMTTAAAQDAAHDQSRAFAAQSRTALTTGDRLSARGAALQGLPEAPSDADLERFSEAYDAFLRAAVSRNLRLHRPQTSVFAFDRTGKRLASVDIFPTPGGDHTKSGLTLWDAETGAKLADLRPSRTITDGGGGVQEPAFSPNGRLLVQIAGADGVAVVFDTETGTEIARLDGHAQGLLPNSGGLAFSRDGSLLLTLGASPAAVYLWDTSTWTRLAHQDFAPFTLLAPIDGGRDGVMQFLVFDGTQSDPSPLSLWSISAEGASRTRPFPAVPSSYLAFSGRVMTDDEDRFFALQNGRSDVLIFERSTGDEVARLPAPLIGPATAVIAPNGDGILLVRALDRLPRRIDFSGADAALTETDKLAGLQSVSSPRGQLLGIPADLIGYRGGAYHA